MGLQDALMCAAERGDLEAVQLLVGHWRARHGAAAAPPDNALALAIASGCVSTATLLRQAGCGFDPSAFASASARGDLPMVRWLAEAGCPFDRDKTIYNTVYAWPRDSAADGERLLEALRVLAELGAPVVDVGQLWLMAVFVGHSWAVLQGLGLPCTSCTFAAAAGCEATLRAFMATDAFKRQKRVLQVSWYAYAAANGDLGTLACLQRLGLRLGRGVIGVAVWQGAPLPALRWLVKQGAPWDGSELAARLSKLKTAYPSSRKQERREVEAWLRELMGSWEAACKKGSKLCTHMVVAVASFTVPVVLALAARCCGLLSWAMVGALLVTCACLVVVIVIIVRDLIA